MSEFAESVLSIPVTTTIGDVAVVAVAGEIDISVSDVFERSIMEALNTEPKRLVVNLLDVTYMDSSSLGVLVRTQRKAAERNCSLVLVSQNPHLTRLFQIVRMNDLLLIYPTVVAALAVTA